MTRPPNSASLVDRRAQNLPVPLGGIAPVHAVKRRRRHMLRRLAPAVAVAVGVASAAAGHAMLAVPSPNAVSRQGSRLDIGAMVLHRVAVFAGTHTELYGGDASFALNEQADGTVVAAAAWWSAGQVDTGFCRLSTAHRRAIDECSFVMPRGTMTSIDVLDLGQGHAWQRTYADGVRISIAVSNSSTALPVPFPIGR